MVLVTALRIVRTPAQCFKIGFRSIRKSAKKQFVFGSGVLLSAHSTSAPLRVNETDFKLLNADPAPLSIKYYVHCVIFVVRVVIGFIKYLFIFAPVLLSYPVTLLDERWFEKWSKLLLMAIQTAGPVSVKLGQWASTRRDLFPGTTCDLLSRLQRRSRPHPWSATKSIISESFGKDVSEIFTEIDETPVGSGCVAQVYKAKLAGNLQSEDSRKKEDRYVAVKVLHPGIEEQFRVDLSILRFGARFLNAIYWPLQWLDLPRCVDEFEKIMMGQVDLRIEAENLDAFTRNFHSNGDVKFPKPVYPFVTEKVLVETYENGIPIEQFCGGGTIEDSAIRKALAAIGANTLLKMVFQDNFVHGDLHPGNLMVKYLHEESPRPYLVVLDCGIVTKLSEKDLKDFRDTFKAIILKQGEKVAELFLERSFNRCSDPAQFTKEMAALVIKLRGEKLTLRKTRVGELMQDVFSLMIRHKIRVESQFSSVVLAVGILEGVGRSLDPDMDLLKVATPYVIQEISKDIFTSTKDFLKHFLEEGAMFSPFE